MGSASVLTRANQYVCPAGDAAYPKVVSAPRTKVITPVPSATVPPE